MMDHDDTGATDIDVFIVGCRFISRFRDASMLSGTIRAVFLIKPNRVRSIWFTMSFSGDDVVAPPMVRGFQR